MSKARFWCLTLFSGDEFKLPEHPLDLIGDKVDGKSVTYAIAGYETCPQTERLHCHVYVEFKNPRAMGGVKNWIGSNSAHCEPRREKDSNKASILYCKGYEKREEGKEEPADWPEEYKGYQFKDEERKENIWHEAGN